MKKRHNASASLELFLDTISNVFGGVIFIALLIAIQIQHSSGTIQSQEVPSPEVMATLQQELDQISSDIARDRVLLETLQAAMPRPLAPTERERADLFYKLSEAKGVAVEQKATLLNQRFAMEKEMLDWETKIKTATTTLQQMQIERERLAEEVGKLNRQVEQNQRIENVYMPRLREAASNKSPKTFVLHSNRLYFWGDKNHFDHVLNESDGSKNVIPKANAGILVEDTPASRRQIFNLFDKNVNSRTEYPSMQVYRDSADVWHIIREMHISAGVEYELIPKTTYARIPPPGGNRPPGGTPTLERGGDPSRETRDKTGQGTDSGSGTGTAQGQVRGQGQ